MTTDKTINSFFDELRVVERTPIIELKSIYGISPIRDITVGSVTNDGTEYELTGSDGAPADLSTAERGPYPPGQEVEPGIACRLMARPTGGQVARIGYYDDEDGFYIEFNANGMDLIVRRDSVDKVVDTWGTWGTGEKSDFIQRDDGAGVQDFNPLLGYVYQFPFVWYGFGPASFTYQMAEKLGGRWIRQLGESRPQFQTSIVQPHLPVRAEAITGSGEADYPLRVSGRQVNIVGKYNPIFRQTSVEAVRADVDNTAWFPIAAIRRKSVKPYALTKLESLDVLSTADVRVAVIEDQSVTNGANWAGEVTDFGSLSLLEENTDPGGTIADDAFDGNMLLKKRVSAGGLFGGLSGESESVSRAFMIEGRPFVIAVRNVGGGTADVTVTAVFREDW